MHKRQRPMDLSAAPHDQSLGQALPATVSDDAFINDQDAVESAGDDDDDDEKPKSDKKAGRRKIKIEFIQDKSRRHITFSKRKAGIMKKAYELSTLTGTQVLLLVVSETGLVYTFTTAKLQPLVTQPEGKNLIQACLNAPHGTLPSSLPVGAPISRSAGGPMPPPPVAPPTNLPGGLSIGNQPGGPKDKGDDDRDEEAEERTGAKRRRRSSNAAATRSANNTSPSSVVSPSLSIPPGQQAPQQSSPQPQPAMPTLGSPTSPNQAHAQVPPPNSGQYNAPPYGHHQHHPSQGDMYAPPPHMMQGYSYGPPPTSTGGPQGNQLSALASTASQQGHWQQQPPQQQAYARR